MESKLSKAKTPAELNKKIQELKAELFTLRFQNATGQLEHNHKIKKIKREIARVFTILAQQKSQPSQILNPQKSATKIKVKQSTSKKTDPISKQNQERQKEDKS